MNAESLMERLAVCSWSLQPATAQELITKLQATGIRRVQLALDPLWENPGAWETSIELFERARITAVSGMFGCLREDYSTLESIRTTGGLAPDQTSAENPTTIQKTAQITLPISL